jgi:hypothetical protein
MRHGVLVLLALAGSSSLASAQVQFVPAPGTQPQSSAVKADDVVARLLTFDHDSDGRVTVSELSERMRPLLARGDTNGDGALDRSEIGALAAAPAPLQTRFQMPAGYSFGDDSGFSTKMHIEGALDDLRLAADKKDRALPIATAYAETVEADAKTDLLHQLEPLFSPQQLAAFKDVLARKPREIRLRMGGPEGERLVVMPGDNLTRRLEAMKLSTPNSGQAAAALAEYKLRLRLGREADRSELLARLNDVLDDEELDNFRAALERRPVVASPFFVVTRDRVLTAGGDGDVVPAVLIERIERTVGR